MKLRRLMKNCPSRTSLPKGSVVRQSKIGSPLTLRVKKAEKLDLSITGPLCPESGHPIFHAALDGCTEFELTHWTGQQLATTYVIPMFAVKEDTLIRG
jgi:hypothetical protein